jgi:hypothetical protein
MTEELEILEHEGMVLNQLRELRDVLDLYNGISKFYSDSEYIERRLIPVMSEAEILKCAKYLAGGGDKEKLIARLDELEMQPRMMYRLKIGFVNAKKRYDNLKAFHQLRFKKL